MIPLSYASFASFDRARRGLRPYPEIVAECPGQTRPGVGSDRLDLAVVVLFLAIALGWGARHARRAGRSTETLRGGSKPPWWRDSIVATTFAADTLAIAGLVATGGIAGNWFWWADVLLVLMGAFLASHLVPAAS